VSPADLLGGVILVALVVYAATGGADFGGGIWDLLASGPRREEQRALVEEALAPIWEANHVWLILVVVVLFSGFPAAFGAVSIALFVPLMLLVVGIVLRGAAFTYRVYDVPEERVRARWGLLFAVSSILASLALGIVVGALASGRLAGAAGGAHLLAWLAPFPLLVGLFATTLFAFVAATYLAVEAEGPVREDFRRRGGAAGFMVLLLAVAVGALSAREAPIVFRGLTDRPWSSPLQLVTALAAATALAALWLDRVRLARAAAVVQLALIVFGWGAAQYPFLVVPDLTLEAAGAPRNVQVALLWALGSGAVLLFPALHLLFRTFKGERPFSLLDRRQGPP
jgi:cytochrome d ubiquinol oxidase subunit II